MVTTKQIIASDIQGVLAKYGSKFLNEKKSKFFEHIIGSDCKIPNDERLILLGCLLHNPVGKLYDSKIYSSASGEEREVYDFRKMLNCAFINNVERFCESVNFCKQNIDNISQELEALKEISLQDINCKYGEFIFDVDSLYFDALLEVKLKTKAKDGKDAKKIKTKFEKTLDEMKLSETKSLAVPEIVIKNTAISYKTKEVAYKYLYSVFMKSYGTNDLLPLIIFQSIFNRAGNLLRAVDDSFCITKEEETSDSDNYVIKHIKNKSTRIFNDNAKTTSNMSFEKETFKKDETKGKPLKLTKCFTYEDFGTSKSHRYNLTAIGWYNYFVELCCLLMNHKNFKSGYDLFQKNCIAFLCMSNIFDLIFVTGEYGEGGLSNSFKIPVSDKDNANPDFLPDNYEFYPFNWNLRRVCEDKIKRGLLKKQVCDFLLDYMGIKKVREKLGKNKHTPP